MFSLSNRIFAKAGMAAFLTGILALGALTSASAAGNLVTDGGFEDVTVNNGFTTFAGGSNFSGWAVGGNGVDVVNSSYWVPAAGNNSLDLNANDAGSISQALTTVIGKTYTLNFSLASNPAYFSQNAIVKGVTVTAGNDLSKTVTFDSTGHSDSDMGWTTKSYTFTATSTSTLLQFTSTTAGYAGAALDNISVTATPEANSVIGFGLMFLGGIFFMARSKKLNKSNVLA